MKEVFHPPSDLRLATGRLRKKVPFRVAETSESDDVISKRKMKIRKNIFANKEPLILAGNDVHKNKFYFGNGIASRPFG